MERHPVTIDGRTMKPHKAIRRVVDHTIDLHVRSSRSRVVDSVRVYGLVL